MKSKNKSTPPHEHNAIELFFDDGLDDIKKMLYEKEPYSPTKVSIRFPLIEIMDEIRRLFDRKSIPDFSKRVKELLKGTYPISSDIYIELNGFLSQLIPGYPKPFLKYKIKDFKPIIENMWDYAQKEGYQEEFGTNVYRWYEHNGSYPQAREVLQKLIDIARSNKSRIDEAVYINNFAFEYLLEQNWEMATPQFKKAAEIFSEENNAINHFNARANYLTCQIEGNNIENPEETEKELNTIADKLYSPGSHHTRKAYFLLARLEEQKGNLKKAMAHAEKAVRASKSANTTYLIEDREFLKKLKKTFAIKRGEAREKTGINWKAALFCTWKQIDCRLRLPVRCRHARS